MAGSAVVGGLILAMIEGVGILINRMTADQFRPMGPEETPPTGWGAAPSGNQQYQ